MDSPTTEFRLFWEIYTGFAGMKITCSKVLFAPTDVQLDMDNKTIVEPDLIVLCDLQKLRKKRIFGAPDLLVEILSPSTHSKDMLWKNSKYQKAGVREYWMVDPEKRKVLVNLFENREGEYRSRLYDFDQRIPVGISRGMQDRLCTDSAGTEEPYGDENWITGVSPPAP